MVFLFPDPRCMFFVWQAVTAFEQQYISVSDDLTVSMLCLLGPVLALCRWF